MATQQGNVTGKAPDNANEIEAAKTEGHAAGLAEGMAAQKTRINAILACANAKERPAAAMAAAMDSDMTVEQANTFLGRLVVEKTAAVVAEPGAGNETSTSEPQSNANFEAAMNRQSQPNVGGGEGNGSNEQGRQPAGNPLALAYSGATGAKRRDAA